MRKATLSFLFLCFSYAMQAELIPEGAAIGVTFSGFRSDAGRTFDKTTDLIGQSTHHLFGITYIHPLSKRFDVEIGLEFGTMYFVDSKRIDDTAYAWGLVEIPVGLRFNFYRFFFVNGGISMDVAGFGNDEFTHLSSSRPSSFVAMLGAGAQYDFKNRPIGIFINPFYKYRTLPYFGQMEGTKRIRNTLENGFRVGVVCRFD